MAKKQKRNRQGEILIAPPKELSTKSWAYPTTTLPEAYALQALERGEATPEQQQKALNWLVNKMCLTYDMSYRPDSDRDSAFAEGRRFVGLQIVRFIKTNLAIYKGENDE